MTFPDPATIDSYGGALANKRALTDPLTQQDAPALNVMKVDCASMTNTADQAWVRFVTHATTPFLALTNNGGAGWGNAPGVRAAVTRIGSGHFRLTWPEDIDDALGATHVLNFVRATVTCEGTTCVHAKPAAIAANVVDIYTFNAAGTANDIAGTTIHVRVA